MLRQVAAGIRNRLQDVVAKEYTNSSYEDVNHDSYYVWAAYDWWAIPWYDILAEGAPPEGDVDGAPKKV